MGSNATRATSQPPLLPRHGINPPLFWSCSTAWRCEKVPRSTSWPLSRTWLPVELGGLLGAACGFRRWLPTRAAQIAQARRWPAPCLAAQHAGKATALHLTPSSQQNAQVSLPAHAAPAGLQHSPSASSVPKASASPMPQSMPSPLSTMLRRASYTCIYRRTGESVSREGCQTAKKGGEGAIRWTQGRVRQCAAGQCPAVKHAALLRSRRLSAAPPQLSPWLCEPVRTHLGNLPVRREVLWQPRDGIAHLLQEARHWQEAQHWHCCCRGQ